MYANEETIQAIIDETLLRIPESAVQTITFNGNIYRGQDVTIPKPSYNFYEITDRPTTLQGYNIQDAATLEQGNKADSAIQGALQDGSEIPINDEQQLVLPNFPTELPASDVYAWAKASIKPSYSFDEILNKPLGQPTIVDEGGSIVSIGVATLDTEGKVPTSQLPSYVDDVLEYPTKSDFPEIGASGVIYLAKDENKTYRWTGTTYGVIGSDLALGETSATAYAGDKGKMVADNLSALATSFNSHTINTTLHITADERVTWNGKYVKPSTGIPKTDLSSAVQTSLGLADSALQEHQDISGKADKVSINAGTYTSVTVNAQGIVTGGSNPTPDAVDGDVIATTLTIPTSAPTTVQAGSMWISV